MDYNDKKIIPCPYCGEDMSGGLVVEVAMSVVPFVDDATGKVMIDEKIVSYGDGEGSVVVSFRCPFCGEDLDYNNDNKNYGIQVFV